MKPLKLFGMVLFCALLSPTRGILSGLSCAISPSAMQQAMSNIIIHKGLLQDQLQDMVLPDIVSDGGLLNSPTIITGLHLEMSRLPTLKMALLPGIGIQFVTTMRLDLSGKCLVGLLSEIILISVDVTITTNIKCSHFESGVVQVTVDDCTCIIGTVNVKLLSGFLSLPVHDLVLSHLTVALPGLLCPVMDIVFNIANAQLLATLDVTLPLGLVGMVHYHVAGLPFISGSYVVVHLNGMAQQMGGSIIPHDSHASALPLLVDRSLILCVRQEFLESMLVLVLHIQSYILPCSSEAFPGGNQLRDSIIALFPAGCTKCPAAAPLSIRVECVGRPILLLEPNKATLKVSVRLHVFAKLQDESVINLLVLNANLSLRIHLSISRGSLMLAFYLGSASLYLESSEIGIADISSLKPHIISLLVDTYLQQLNDNASAGLPLPGIFGIPMLRMEFQILLKLLVISL